MAQPALNPVLDRLTDYPFQRLRDLLDATPPPAGVAPLVLSIGEPQDPPPALLAEALAADAHLWGRYPPLAGTPEWGRAAAGWISRRYGLPEGAITPDHHLLPVAGTREALYLIASVAVPEPGAVVLLPNPFYQVYLGAAVMNGARPELLPATVETGFLPDLAAVDPATWARASMLYLCSPANPQGAVADRDYLARAIGLARRHGLTLVVDECYAEIYHQDPPPGALEVAWEMDRGFDNVLVFHSLSKRSSAAGLRSGFVAGDPALIAAFSRLRSYAGATLGLPILAASAALWSDEEHVIENRRRYRHKFDLADSIIGDRFGYRRPAGGFFLWLDVGDGEAAAKKLWEQGGLRVLPGRYLARDEADGTNPGAAFIRVALVHDPETTATALERIVRILG